MDEARLPFTMNATVSYGTLSPEPLPDQLLPGWVRIPVSFQVMLPAEVIEGARQGAPLRDRVAVREIRSRSCRTRCDWVRKRIRTTGGHGRISTRCSG